jgi:tetratricopeptide (TPR) repeat protein
VAAAVANLGVTAAQRGDDEAAEGYLAEALDRLRRIGAAAGGAAARIPDIVTIGEVTGPRWEVGGRLRCVLEETVVPFRERGATEAIGHVRCLQGVMARQSGAPDLAAQRLAAAHRAFSELGDDRGIAEVLARQGNLALSVGDTATARACFLEAHRLRRRLGDPRLSGLMVLALGSVALAEGDVERAQRLDDSAGALFTRAGDRPGYSAALSGRADLALMTGDYDGAEERYADLARWQPRAQPLSTMYLADVAEARADVERARRLLVEAHAGLRASYGRRAVAACAARIAMLSAA